MKSPFATWKSVVLTFLLAAVFYIAAYSWMNRRQTGHGPWLADFQTNLAGAPEIVISEPALGLSNITVQFIGERLASTNKTGSVAFARPQTITPFGRVVYDDLMFQPGVVTLDCFGHLVEMAPRSLGLNGISLPWTNNVLHVVSATNKMPADKRNKLRGGYRR